MSESGSGSGAPTRREMMQTSAKMTVAGALVGVPSILSAAPDSQTLGLAVIGCGGRGRRCGA